MENQFQLSPHPVKYYQNKSIFLNQTREKKETIQKERWNCPLVRFQLDLR